MSWQRRVGSAAGDEPDRSGALVRRRGAMRWGCTSARSGIDWLRDNIGEALGWGEFALLSSLSCDYLVHLGVDHARDSDKSTRSMTATGAMVWMLLLLPADELGGGLALAASASSRGLEGMLLVSRLPR